MFSDRNSWDFFGKRHVKCTHFSRLLIHLNKTLPPKYENFCVHLDIQTRILIAESVPLPYPISINLLKYCSDPKRHLSGNNRYNKPSRNDLIFFVFHDPRIALFGVTIFFPTLIPFCLYIDNNLIGKLYI